MSKDFDQIKVVLVTDCGSTTTKALLFEKTESGWRHTFRGEAPTTVEEPIADVTVGAINAFQELEDLSSRKILDTNQTSDAPPFLQPAISAGQGIDLYLSSSSAGGGLQMMVAGVVGQLSTESAHRAALGAGAIVLDSLSVDDAREDYQRIERVRQLRPDIILLTGGVEGGASTQVIELAEILRAASPKPRFGNTLKVPVIYAGNSENIKAVDELLQPIADLIVVDNVRPDLQRENLAPARLAIHEIFLTHVMSHSPGYSKLLSWSPKPILPTPAAVGDMVQHYAARFNAQVLCADIGGATTDVFSVFKDRQEKAIFNRTVSANFGMSYSIANVLVEAGIERISQWLPFEIEESDLRDRIRNKMIRPTSIPQTKQDLWIEQAVCREALRLSLEHHKSLAIGMSDQSQKKGIASLFSNNDARYELVDISKLDIVIGSGGVLSHAPNRLSAALMMIDGFALSGITELAVDSIFMMPHLGVLASVNPEAAQEIFLKDCIVPIALHIKAISLQKLKLQPGQEIAEIYLDQKLVAKIKFDKLIKIDLAASQEQELEIRPLDKQLDFGAGVGQIVRRKILSNRCLILDARQQQDQLKRELKVAKQRELFSDLSLL